MFDRFAGLYSRLLFLLALLTALAACNGSSNSFPQIANPPPFDYADGQELRAGMHQLAFELQQLEMTLAGVEDGDLNLREDIVSSLRDIERIGGSLQTRDLSTTHSFLKNDMNRFLSSVTRARTDVERIPPRYYAAGRVAGGCVNCHRISQ